MKWTACILCVLFLIAIFLRFAFLNNNLFFGPEQGRDLLVVKDIVLNHKLTLIGSKTDISGVFHGPLFYYLSTIPFILSHGDPLFISFFFVLINSATVFPLYLLGKKLRNKQVGLLAALLFAFSFNAIVYARWLSNPPLSIPFAASAMYFLVAFLKGSKKSLLGFSIFIGLLNQAEFLNILFYAVIIIGIYVIFFDRFRKLSPVFLFLNIVIITLLSVGTFILFDLRHQFLITNSILHLLTGQTGFSVSFLSSVEQCLSVFLTAFGMTVFPFWTIPGYVVLLASLIVVINISRKQKEYNLFILWLFIPVVLLICLHQNVLDQFFVSLLPAFLLLTAILVDAIWKKFFVGGLLVLLVLIFSSLFFWFQNIPSNTNIFFQLTQPDLRYNDELATIDQVYKESGNTPFAIQTYTIPYWSQQAWQYLFWSYGEKRYGKAVGEEKDAKDLFVIIQADPGNPAYQEAWLKNIVSTWGKLQKTFHYGILTTREVQLER